VIYDRNNLDASSARRPWRAPTIREIAEATGLGTATIDRVLNDRGGVSEATRIKVHQAQARLSGRGRETLAQGLTKIAFLSDSGTTFNASLEATVKSYVAAHQDVECSFAGIDTAAVETAALAALIEQAAERAHGLVIVAREALAINRAVRNVTARGVPVVCLTTDLPTSDRIAYIGSDQTNAGATAAYLLGRLLRDRVGKILLVISAPYRCQEERELGFRRVLRSEFPNLQMQERINSNDALEHSYRGVSDFVREHGAPIGVYNVAGGNRGVARALIDHGLRGKTVFIGHELNAHSRMLLEAGEMDVVVGHDLEREVATSIATLTAYLRHGTMPPISATQISIFTKYNCN
jgi:LacI family transcriptional regulator